MHHSRHMIIISPILFDWMADQPSERLLACVILKCCCWRKRREKEREKNQNRFSKRINVKAEYKIKKKNYHLVAVWTTSWNSWYRETAACSCLKSKSAQSVYVNIIIFSQVYGSVCVLSRLNRRSHTKPNETRDQFIKVCINSRMLYVYMYMYMCRNSECYRCLFCFLSRFSNTLYSIYIQLTKLKYDKALMKTDLIIRLDS